METEQCGQNQSLEKNKEVKIDSLIFVRLCCFLAITSRRKMTILARSFRSVEHSSFSVKVISTIQGAASLSKVSSGLVTRSPPTKASKSCSHN